MVTLEPPLKPLLRTREFVLLPPTETLPKFNELAPTARVAPALEVPFGAAATPPPQPINRAVVRISSPSRYGAGRWPLTMPLSGTECRIPREPRDMIVWVQRQVLRGSHVGRGRKRLVFAFRYFQTHP